jgi:PRC-barrel domain protein
VNTTAVGSSADQLRYLEAHHVQYPQGTLADLNLRTEDDEQIGSIDGVLIDPAHRRVRYFVISGSGWFPSRRFLLDAESPAVVEPEERLLRVQARADDIERRRFDARGVAHFSDADVVTAMFAA